MALVLGTAVTTLAVGTAITCAAATAALSTPAAGAMVAPPAIAAPAPLLSAAVALSPRPRIVPAVASEPSAGDLLIASRRLDDANFARTVVLLIEAGPDGALGVVVNRPTPIRLAVAMPGIEALRDRADRIWWGGPVAPESAVMLARLSSPPPDGREIAGEVWLVRTKEAIESVLGRGLPEGSLRVFSGYAGWGGGQLEWELSLGSWHLRRAGVDDVFSTEPEKLWDELVRIAAAPVA